MCLLFQFIYVSFFIYKHSLLQKKLSSIMVAVNDHCFFHLNFFLYTWYPVHVHSHLHKKYSFDKGVCWSRPRFFHITNYVSFLYVNINIHHFCCSYIMLAIIGHLYLCFNLLWKSTNFHMWTLIIFFSIESLTAITFIFYKFL